MEKIDSYDPSAHNVNNETPANKLKFAIKGVNLNKTYSRRSYLISKTKSIILDNLNINVVRGHIYGLLGPSGCGKTTLLKCLIGLIDVDSGDILIDEELKNQKNDFFNLNLKKIGFMPQDYCLFDELSIWETLYYFGRLMKMKPALIKTRANFLIKLLDLPSKQSFICHLSGGQLRRTSFAVSLLNEPSILMLDEPTVGMDPLLRKRIWDYLINLTHTQKTTIIITTHYIEEARQADFLGFMRKGRIIEENKPEALMTKYNHNILEEVFYSICCNTKLANNQNHSHKKNSIQFIDESFVKEDKQRISDGQIIKEEFKSELVSFVDSSNNLSDEILIKNKRDSNFCRKLSKTIKNEFSMSFQRIIANMYKDLLKCRRNTKLLIIQFLVPIIQITFFCLCIGRTPKDLPIGYFDEDAGYMDFKFGTDIINHIDNSTLLKMKYSSLEDGINGLKLGTIWSFFHIDKNFTNEVVNLYINGKKPIIEHDFKNFIHIYSDNTNDQISLTINQEFYSSIKKVIEQYIKLVTDKNETSYPIKYEKPIYGSEKPVFTYFMAPGIALSVIFFMSVASTASNFVLERRLGLSERSYLSGVRTIEILLSQLIVYSILMVVQVVIIICLLFGFLKLPLKGSILLLIFLITSQGFCGLCYGLCLASILFNEETVIQVTLASFYPILLTSGIIWPIEAQPWWLKNISQFSPLTYASEAFRAILEKNKDLRDLIVFRGFLTTYIWTILFALCFLIMFSRRFRIIN